MILALNPRHFGGLGWAVHSPRFRRLGAMANLLDMGLVSPGGAVVGWPPPTAYSNQWQAVEENPPSRRGVFSAKQSASAHSTVLRVSGNTNPRASKRPDWVQEISGRGPTAAQEGFGQITEERGSGVSHAQHACRAHGGSEYPHCAAPVKLRLQVVAARLGILRGPSGVGVGLRFESDSQSREERPRRANRSGGGRRILIVQPKSQFWGAKLRPLLREP